jgi:hypothetical protein
MPTLLDGVLETHDGPEPRVITEDVQAILRRIIRPGDEDAGASVALIARRARVSTRTVYRVLNPGESKPTIGLDLADRLCIAAGSGVGHCRFVHSNGRVTDSLGNDV